MKNIQYFKLFESRTAELLEEEFLNLVKTKCRDFIKTPKYLQRMKSSYNGEYSYINPIKSHRSPLIKDEFEGGGVFSNHHTLLMDNLPSWKYFPKRTQSIIGSTNFNYDTSFGNHYYCIIPYDGANFGVAPSADLWNSSCKITLNNNNNNNNISSYEYQFDDYFSESFLQAGISDDTFDNMMRDIQNLFNDYIKSDDTFDNMMRDIHDYINNKKPLITKYIIRIFDKMNEDNIKDVKSAFNDYFSPDKFRGFSIKTTPFLTMNYSEISSIPEKESNGNLIKQSREFWTDSECLLVYLGMLPNSGTAYEKFKSILELFS